MLCLRAKARRQRKMLPPKVSCDLDHNGHELVDSLMLIYESGFAGDQRHRDDMMPLEKVVAAYSSS